MSEAPITLITGAGSGIGAALCRQLANSHPKPALVISTGHNQAGLAALAEDCERAGAPVATYVGDLGEPATASALVALAEQRFGGLDRLVHVAGFAERGPIGELDRARLLRSVQIVEGAFFELVTAALPLLARSARARVVAVSSFLAHCYQRVGGRFPASAAAKAGLEALVKSLAAQLAAQGCTVNCVVPGYIRKDPGSESSLSAEEWRQVASSIPLRRLGTPDEVAAAVAFLLSDAAAYITGQALHINGGLNL